MSAQLDPEEVQAIADAMAVDGGEKPPLEVAERDFRIPRRLSLEVVKKLEGTLRNSIPSLKRSLQSVVPAELVLEPIAVREITAAGLFENPSPPFVIARFMTGNAPGWVVWEPSQAIACVQAALGMPDADGSKVDPDRELSFVERRLMARILEMLLAPIAKRFNLEVEGLFIAEKPDDIGSWEDEGPDADAHRLCVEFSLQALETESTITFYLPGFLTAGVDLDEVEEAVEAPAVLGSIPIEIGARFDPVEVPLSQLLEIEVGDVIPLAPVRSAQVTLNVEDRAIASAELGRNYERLAVRVTEIFEAHPEVDLSANHPTES
jgi:flagellar motor switch protein FliM